MVDIVFLGINEIGTQVYNWLNEREDANILALLTEKEQLDIVEDLDPDLIICAGFRDIVPKKVLDIPDKGAVNFHKAYLPYNRGANPNVWSIVEDNPAGVTIHYMTEELDAGPVIDRREVKVKPSDNGKTLYNRLEEVQLQQFKENWEDIRDGTVDTTEQDLEKGTMHRKKDFGELWELDLEEEVKTEDLIDRLRALTFPPYKNAYFKKDGKKHYIEIKITEEDEDSGSGKTDIMEREEDYEG